jgi:hypothetical protein
LREGFAYVRGRAWLWGTLLVACVAVLCIEGPIDIALPYVIKNEWHEGAGTYGVLLAVAGFAGIGASLVVGGLGLPRRPVATMVGLWAVSILAIAGFALVDGLLWAVPFALVFGAGTAGDTMWFALLQTSVPRELLGRVSSLDWMLSFLLLPLSYALAGPLNELLGARDLLIAAAVAGASACALLLAAMPEMRARWEHT